MLNCSQDQFVEVPLHAILTVAQIEQELQLDVVDVVVGKQLLADRDNLTLVDGAIGQQDRLGQLLPVGHENISVSQGRGVTTRRGHNGIHGGHPKGRVKKTEDEQREEKEKPREECEEQVRSGGRFSIPGCFPLSLLSSPLLFFFLFCLFSVYSVVTSSVLVFSGGHALVVQGHELRADPVGQQLQLLQPVLLVSIDLAISEDQAPQPRCLGRVDRAVPQQDVANRLEQQLLKGRHHRAGRPAHLDQKLQFGAVDAAVGEELLADDVYLALIDLAVGQQRRLAQVPPVRHEDLPRCNFLLDIWCPRHQDTRATRQHKEIPRWNESAAANVLTLRPGCPIITYD